MKKSLSEYTNKFWQILDSEDNIIASGKCISLKPNFIDEDIFYISFDDKWFYGNTKCKFKQVEFAETIVPNNPPSFLVWDYWRNNKRGIEVDVYRDFSYDEIDPPIKPYIDKLNNISPDFRTHESCCGHGISNWQVGLTIFKLHTLSKILSIVNTFNGDLIVISNHTYIQFEKYVLLRLCPNPKIQDFDMKLLDKFIKRLSKVFEYND